MQPAGGGNRSLRNRAPNGWFIVWRLPALRHGYNVFQDLAS